MQEKTKGVVLHTFAYNDKISISHVYTEKYGKMSYMLPQAQGKKARALRTLFMPFSLLDMDVETKPAREIQRIREARIWFSLPSIQSDPVKNAETLFLTELLVQVLREPEANPSFFSFLVRSVQFFDMIEEGKANFHLCFLLQLTGFLGFSPNTDEYVPGSRFDMLNGVFTDRLPDHPYLLDVSESLSFMQLMRMDFSNFKYFHFSREQRRNILERILVYYRLHHPGMPELKSPEILKALFD